MVKSGKAVNPVDKARKEARKKELKKNKKQRQQVRSAVIEKKDPEQVICELERLDALEYDLTSDQSTGNELIYKDKRKRLVESWERIIAYYQKEDADRHDKLLKQFRDYEARHRRMSKEFEAIKAASSVKIEDIFLPPEPDCNIDDDIDPDDPLLSESIYITPRSAGLRPPGCPPGLPPDLSQIVESLKSSIATAKLMETQITQAQIKDFTKPHNRHLSHNKRQGGNQRDHDRKQFKSEVPKTDASKSVVAKATVIESKPVIFKPKTTKFIPTSVLSKMSNKDDG